MPRSGHLPGQHRAAFLEAVETFCAWDSKDPAPTVSFEARYKSRKISLSKACGLVWNCSDILPDSVFRDVVALCEFAGVPTPQIRTYAAAARALRPVMNRELERLSGR